MRIFIKNMVSLRYKLIVKVELEKLGIDYKSIELGKVLLVEPLSKIKRQKLMTELHKFGLEVMEDRKQC